MDFLSRHVTGDWGEIPEEDRTEIPKMVDFRGSDPEGYARLTVTKAQAETKAAKKQSGPDRSPDPTSSENPGRAV
jgi:hypothetical protein